MRTSAPVLFAVLLALAGCRREQPPTEVPPSPVIETFTASAREVASGEAVTLSWKVNNATAVELREANQGDLGVAADQLEGTLEVRPTRSALYVLVARGPSGSDARAVSVTVPPDQGQVTFQALPPEIAGGNSTTLVWTAPGATQVSLSANGAPVDLMGQRTSGALLVRPLSDTTWTLTVDGVAYTASVVVQPGILRFEATPTAVQVGQSVTLSWATAGGERVTLSSPGRGQLFDSTTAAQVQSGTFVDTAPDRPQDGVVAYELRLEKAGVVRTRTLEVFVGSALSFVRLEAPGVAARGGAYTVRWTTVAADEVEVLVDSVPVFVTVTAARAANGSFVLPTPMNDFGLEVVATNSRGARVSRALQVDVVGVPTAVTLSATPQAVTAGMPVTLAWAVTEARRVRITDDDGQPLHGVTGQAAESGSVQVFPNKPSTTYTITADNLLGSTPVQASATVSLTGTPVTVSAFPPAALSGARVQVRASEPDAQLVGFPHGQVLVGTRAAFIDISGTGQRLDIVQSPGVALADLPFSTWLWGKRQTGPLVVSRAGWMAWGATLAVDSTESTMPSTSAAKFILAPFWDNLTITAASGVFAEVKGTAPNELLIVQWDKLQVGTDTSTEVTFQVQLRQDGAFSFQYRTMELASGYTSFEIGTQDDTQKLAITPDFQPTSDSALYFFGPMMANADVQVVRGANWGGFVRKSGVSALVSERAVALALPEDLAITEVMARPSVDGGQYLELLNRTAGPLDLTGWYLEGGPGARFNLPGGYSLPPDVPTVLGASLDPSENDDAGVSLSWAASGFEVPRDGGAIWLGQGDAGFAFVTTGAGAPGVAAVLDPGLFRIGTSSLMRSLVCNATTPFGGQAPQQLGTPGVGSGCGFGYRVRAIPAHFVDVTDGGTALVNSPAAAVTALTVPITLAATGADPAPTVFGARVPVVSMSLDGWLALESLTTVNLSNKTTPGTTTSPRGLVAPFWDDLQTTLGLTPESDMYWKRMAAGEDPQRPEPHWIFEWHRVRHLSTNPPDDITFEVKLFEDGTIEYHYATLTSGTSSNYASGSSATVWLERSDSGVALTQSVNTADVRANTAWRFIPQ